MFTFSPATTSHHSRCHYFSCAVFFVHQFNVYVVHSVGSYINTHSHACTLSHTLTRTYKHAFTLYTKSMGRRRRRRHSHHRYTHALHINRLVAITLCDIYFFLSRFSQMNKFKTKHIKGIGNFAEKITKPNEFAPFSARFLQSQCFEITNATKSR